MTLDMVAEPALTVPGQRRPATGDRCHRCGAAEGKLKPDADVAGQMRCDDMWSGCFEAWRPHCPVWCTHRHSEEVDGPFLNGVWFHTSPGIDVIVGESIHIQDTIQIGLCAFERVGGGLQTPTITIGDDVMLPSAARALASVLVASADMADMSGAALRIGEAHERPPAGKHEETISRR